MGSEMCIRDRHCYELICDKVVLKYEKNFGIDDVVVEEELSE